MEEESSSALSLTFAYHGTEIQLESVQRLEMLAYASDAIKGHQDHAGFWIEVRDGEDNIVYRRVMQNPINHEIESHQTKDSDEKQRLHLREEVSGEFNIVIPDFDQNHSLIMFNSIELHGVVDYESPPSAATQIARFPLINASNNWE